MGNCTIKRSKKASQNYTSSVKINVPNLFYLSRSEKSLLVVENSESRQYSLQKKLKLFRDSSISLLSDSSLIISGGSDSSSSLTNRVYQIFPYSSLLTSLPPLPVPCKFGVFHLYNSSSLIYVGGICESQDNDSSHIEQGAPICRITLGQSSWEVFTGKASFDPGKYLMRNVVYEEDKSVTESNEIVYADVTIKDLYEPGSVIIRDSLVMIGGKICRDRKMVTSDKVFSVRLDQEFFIKQEEFEMPVGLVAPSCAVKNEKIFIAGGLLDDMSHNFEVFVVEWGSKSVRKVELAFERPVELRYPIIVEDKGIWCFSPPKMLYLREDKKQVFTFSLNSQAPRVEINVAKATQNEEQVEFKKVVVDLSLHIITEKTQTSEVKIINRVKDDEDKKDDGVQVEVFTVSKKKKQENEINDLEPAIELVEIELPSISSYNIEEEKRSLCYICNGEMMRIDKFHLLHYQDCFHCHSHHSKLLLCPTCSITFCSSCTRKLKKYPLCEPVLLKCSNNHNLCHYQSPTSSCINCFNKIESNHLFCFICNEHLCIPCHESLSTFINSSPHCYNSHKLTWALKPNPICSNCFKTSTSLIHFSCKICDFFECTDCLNEKNHTLIITDRNFTNPKENLSYNLHDDESNLHEEAAEKQFKLEKNENKIEEFEEIDERPMPDESEISATQVQESFKYMIPLEELRKKIPQKPIRGEKSPFFLSLSPGKVSNENNKEKKNLMRKSLGDFSLGNGSKADYHDVEPISQHAGNFRLSAVLNSETSERSSEFETFGNFFKGHKNKNKVDYREESEVFSKSVIEQSYGIEENSHKVQSIEFAKTNKLKENFEVRPDFRDKIDELLSKHDNEKRGEIENNERISNSHKKKKKTKEIEDEVFDGKDIVLEEDQKNDEKNKKQKKLKEYQNKNKKSSLDPTSSSSSSENLNLNFQLKLKPILESEENLKSPNNSKFSNSSKNQSNSSLSNPQDQVLIFSPKNNVLQQTDLPELSSQIEIPFTSYIKITPEEPEETAFLESSIFFPTTENETEQVAPVIDKTQGKDKLQALKAKLNLLTENSEDFSSSFEPNESGFNGFVIGNFQVSDSEPENLMRPVKAGEVKRILDDLDECEKFNGSKDSRDDASSSESGSYAIFNPFDVCENFEGDSGIKVNEFEEGGGLIEEVEEKLLQSKKCLKVKKEKRKKSEKVKRLDESEEKQSEDKSKIVKKKEKKCKKKSSSSDGSAYGFVFEYE